MTIAQTTHRLLSAAAAAALLSALPVAVDFTADEGAALVKASTANARDGRDGGRDRGGDNSGHGSDHGGRDNDSSGPGSGGDDRGGHGGDDDRNDDHRDDDGRDRNGGDDDRNDDGRGGAHHIDPASGAKIEVAGDRIEIVYPNGWKEEHENGRYELKDPSGRTVVERPATAEDVARLESLAI